MSPRQESSCQETKCKERGWQRHACLDWVPTEYHSTCSGLSVDNFYRRLPGFPVYS